MKKDPTISVIVITYYGQFLRDCLKSLEHQIFKDFEVIIVCNSTDPKVINFIKNYQSTLKVSKIFCSQNRGFAGGCLIGLQHARGKFIALINDDAEADQAWLFNLIKAMEKYPNVGACASKIIKKGTNLIDSAGDGYLTSFHAFKRGTNKEALLYNTQEYVFGACAAGAMYRKQTLNCIGFFDEDFFFNP